MSITVFPCGVFVAIKERKPVGHSTPWAKQNTKTTNYLAIKFLNKISNIIETDFLLNECKSILKETSNIKMTSNSSFLSNGPIKMFMENEKE